MSHGALSLSFEVTHPAGSETSGPPVLLIHGFASKASADWSGWPGQLATFGRTCVLVDLPGHESGPVPTSAVEVVTDKVVDALAAVSTVVDADQVDVVAYSLGARLAWDLASRGVVRRLVLGGISPGEPFSMVDIEQLRTFVAEGTVPTDPFTAMMSQMISVPGANSASLELLVEGLAAGPFQPTAQNAPKVPTLFVAGESDQMAEGIDGLVSLVAGAEVVRVPGDHRAALLSEEFRSAALAFLG